MIQIHANWSKFVRNSCEFRTKFVTTTFTVHFGDEFRTKFARNGLWGSSRTGPIGAATSRAIAGVTVLKAPWIGGEASTVCGRQSQNPPPAAGGPPALPSTPPSVPFQHPSAERGAGGGEGRNGRGRRRLGGGHKSHGRGHTNGQPPIFRAKHTCCENGHIHGGIGELVLELESASRGGIIMCSTLADVACLRDVHQCNPANEAAGSSDRIA